MVRVRGGAEKHGVEFLKRLRQIQQEEKAKNELAKAMAALGMEDDRNRPGSEWGTGLSAVTKQRNLEEKREEEKRRILLEQARRESAKKTKRERREQESEKWKYRKMIVEGHDLNLWRDHIHDAFPEQSWDLRRVVEVQSKCSPPLPAHPRSNTDVPGQFHVPKSLLQPPCQPLNPVTPPLPSQVTSSPCPPERQTRTKHQRRMQKTRNWISPHYIFASLYPSRAYTPRSIQPPLQPSTLPD